MVCGHTYGGCGNKAVFAVDLRLDSAEDVVIAVTVRGGRHHTEGALGSGNERGERWREAQNEDANKQKTWKPLLGARDGRVLGVHG